MPDAIVLLKNDHKEVERLFKQFEKLGDQAYKQKRDVADQIIEKLSVHAAIEEEHFYPTVRKEAAAIRDVVLESLEEHHIVKWTLSELEKLNPEEERFTPKMTVLIESVRHHVTEEETELFPKIREVMGRKPLAELGDTLERARVAAPTRPHPQAPDTPPGNLVAGPAAAVSDKAQAVVRRGLLRKKG